MINLRRARRTGVLEPFSLITLVFLFVWVVITLLPAVRLVGMALTPADGSADTILSLIPTRFSLANFAEAVRFMREFVTPLPRVFLNSVVYSTAGTAIALAVAIPASFSFATMQFRGKRVFFYCLLLGLIVPISALLLPEYVTVRLFNIIGTRWAIILPYAAFAMPLMILILTSFFKQISTEIYDAAKIDGCTSFDFLWRIGLPLSKPAVSTCIIFQFLYLWNEFPLALVLLLKQDQFSLPVAVATMMTSRTSPWHLISSVMILATIPVIVVFVLFQAYFVEGLSEGALIG